MLAAMKKTTAKTLTYAVLIGYSICVLYPILWVVLGSMKSNAELFENTWGLPTAINFEIYKKVLVDYGLSVNFLNSIFLSVVCAALSIIVSVMASYAISRMKWKLSKLTLGFILLGLMIPVHSTLIPLYINLQGLTAIVGAKTTLIIPYVAFALPTSIFIISSFMQSLPSELEEAAVLDGCSLFGAFVRIIIPLTTPAIATVFIFSFLGVWNELLFGMIFLTKTTDLTIPVAILKFNGTFQTQWDVIFTVITLTIVPSTVVYMFFQKRIMGGLTAGAVKG